MSKPSLNAKASTTKLPAIKLARGEVLVLRNCRADMSSYDGFIWPKNGTVKAPDWEKNTSCGNGLHGWLEGQGDGTLGYQECEHAVWLVLAVKRSHCVDLDGKIKFPEARILYAGSRELATAIIAAHCPASTVIGGTATAGDRGTATAGDRGTATAGDRGTATAGYRGTATAGDEGTATAGDRGTATAGNRGTATAGDEGTATAGNRGTATAGYRGTATAGDEGTATAGYRGTATAGDEGTATAGNRGTATAGDEGTATAGNRGTATAGVRGTATAGDEGIISIRYYDSKANRYRLAIGYVGENGLKQNTAYRLSAQACFEEVVK